MAKLLLLAILVLLAIYHSSTLVVADVRVWTGPTNGMGSITGAAHAFLDAHNAARTKVGVANLTWSNDLANSASRHLHNQKQRKGCDFADTSDTKYGSNQLSDSDSHVTPHDVVEHWVNQKKHYNNTNHSCAAHQECGSYTQVVWKKSQKLGCAQGACGNKNGSLTICLYDPRGNIGGQFPY